LIPGWAKKHNRFTANWNPSNNKEYPIGHGISPQSFYDLKVVIIE
jgi:hypothetical protein